MPGRSCCGCCAEALQSTHTNRHSSRRRGRSWRQVLQRGRTKEPPQQVSRLRSFGALATVAKTSVVIDEVGLDQTCRQYLLRARSLLAVGRFLIVCVLFGDGSVFFARVAGGELGSATARCSGRRLTAVPPGVTPGRPTAGRAASAPAAADVLPDATSRAAPGPAPDPEPGPPGVGTEMAENPGAPAPPGVAPNEIEPAAAPGPDANPTFWSPTATGISANAGAPVPGTDAKPGGVGSELAGPGLTIGAEGGRYSI